MTKLSFEVDRELEQRLNTYLVKTYNRTHGYHHVVLREALVNFLATKEIASKSREIVLEEIKKNQSAKETPTFGMPLDGERMVKEPAPKRKVKKPTKGGKLTDADHAKIKELLASGITNQKEIARQIGHEDQYQTVLRHIDKIKKESSEPASI